MVKYRNNLQCCNLHEKVGSRRELLAKAGFGFGALALSCLPNEELIASTLKNRGINNPLSPTPPHFPAKAKNVIFMFMKLFKRINLSTEEFENKFWKSKSAESFYNNLPANVNDPMANVFKDSMQVLLKSKRSPNLNEKMSRMLEINIDKQMESIEKSYTFLASVGSTAPFIGLFGTVWGIMNSFQSIAISRNTSLAIVAPGIAEALFATALGLLAAIPAVVAYNKFNSDSKKYSQKLENFSKRLLSII